MIDLLTGMQIVLKEASFKTRLVSVDNSAVVCFENDTIMGFGSVFEFTQQLLFNWKKVETDLLTRYARSFRAAGEKSWNVYSVFLCPEAANSESSREIRWIEEDLQRTRKIAAAGITTRQEIINALLPILPIQQQATLQIEDVTERLERRIKAISPKSEKLLLNESTPISEIIRLLGGLQ